MAGKGKGKAEARNSDRRCGKANKQRPGVSAQAHTGKTVGGYSPAKIEARAAARRLAVSSGE